MTAAFDFATIYAGTPARTTIIVRLNCPVMARLSDRGFLSITYPDAGTYTATLIATNYSGKEPQRAFKQTQIRVLPKP